MWLIILCTYLSWLIFDLIMYIYHWTVNEGKKQSNSAIPNLEKMKFLWAIFGAIVGWFLAKG